MTPKTPSQKTRFSVNSLNQLIVRKRAKCYVVPGTFFTDRHNRLWYRLDEKLRVRKELGLADAFEFEGAWKLDENHDLVLSLLESSSQDSRDRLVIKGSIISAAGDALTFRAESTGLKGTHHLRLLQLHGAWGQDEYNRITFLVAKKAIPDTLTLKECWRLNGNQQIEYTYEKTELKKRHKTEHSLVFEGFWQLNQARRLTYILEKSSASLFNFKAQIESPNLLPQNGVIKYRIGIGTRRPINDGNIVSLYGAWKFQRHLGLSFEMDYGRKGIRRLAFGTSASIDRNKEVALALLNTRKEPLGITVSYGLDFLRKLDARALVKLKHSSRQNSFEAGLKIPF